MKKDIRGEKRFQALKYVHLKENYLQTGLQWSFDYVRPFAVNHICYLLQSFTQANGNKRGLQPFPATRRDRQLK